MPSDSIDGFYQALLKLSKEGSFSSVSAHSIELISDAFINGLQFTDIPQRILEKRTIILQQA